MLARKRLIVFFLTHFLAPRSLRIGYRGVGARKAEGLYYAFIGGEYNAPDAATLTVLIISYRCYLCICTTFILIHV